MELQCNQSTKQFNTQNVNITTDMMKKVVQRGVRGLRRCNYIKTYQSSVVFQEIDFEFDFAYLMKNSIEINFQKGEFLMREGEEINFIFFCIEGQLAYYSTTFSQQFCMQLSQIPPNEKLQIESQNIEIGLYETIQLEHPQIMKVMSINQNQFFGEQDVIPQLDQEGISYNLICESESAKVLRFKKEDFQQIMGKSATSFDIFKSITKQKFDLIQSLIAQQKEVLNVFGNFIHYNPAQYKLGTLSSPFPKQDQPTIPTHIFNYNRSMFKKTLQSVQPLKMENKHSYEESDIPNPNKNQSIQNSLKQEPSFNQQNQPPMIQVTRNKSQGQIPIFKIENKIALNMEKIFFPSKQNLKEEESKSLKGVKKDQENLDPATKLFQTQLVKNFIINHKIRDIHNIKNHINTYPVQSLNTQKIIQEIPESIKKFFKENPKSPNQTHSVSFFNQKIMAQTYKKLNNASSGQSSPYYSKRESVRQFQLQLHMEQQISKQNKLMSIQSPFSEKLMVKSELQHSVSLRNNSMNRTATSQSPLKQRTYMVEKDTQVPLIFSNQSLIGFTDHQIPQSSRTMSAIALSTDSKYFTKAKVSPSSGLARSGSAMIIRDFENDQELQGLEGPENQDELQSIQIDQSLMLLQTKISTFAERKSSKSCRHYTHQHNPKLFKHNYQLEIGEKVKYPITSGQDTNQRSFQQSFPQTVQYLTCQTVRNPVNFSNNHKSFVINEYSGSLLTQKQRYSNQNQ